MDVESGTDSLGMVEVMKIRDDIELKVLQHTGEADAAEMAGAIAWSFIVGYLSGYLHITPQEAEAMLDKPAD